MKSWRYLILLCMATLPVRAQQAFHDVSLSEVLIRLDRSSSYYHISFVYDELEDFRVSTTLRKGRSLPAAVRDVCSLSPVTVKVKGRDIFVECVKKERRKLSGRLVDESSHPVPYANIVLYKQSDMAVIGGGTSNEAGSFVIPCSEEKALVRISCVGLQTLSRNMTVGPSGVIVMKTEAYSLDGVTVNGVSPLIRYEGGRLLYLVANDSFAKGMNALELLGRVPMVSMDRQQPIILGKGSAEIMLNGRPLGMDNETIMQKLQSLHAEDIERIEVVSIPSGRFQTTAASGYVNIVLQRDKTEGWQGGLTAVGALGDDSKGLLSASASYATKGFDVTVDAFGNLQKDWECQEAGYQRQEGSEKVSLTDFTKREREVGTSVMLRYQPTRNVETGGMLSYRTNWCKQKYDDESHMGAYRTRSSSLLQPTDATRTLNLSLYGDWKLDSLGKQLSMTYRHYRKRHKDESGIYGSEKSEGALSFVNVSELESDYSIQTLGLDVTLPYRLATIDAGMAYTDIDNTAMRVDDAVSLLRYILHSNNDYRYQERNMAIYLNAGGWLAPRLQAHVGLRFEFSWLKGNEQGGEDIQASKEEYISTWTDIPAKAVDYRRTNSWWLPSLSLSYNMTEQQQFTLEWAMSIKRPHFSDLDAIPYYKSLTNYAMGNPALMPGTTNHIELSYQHRRGFYANLYYHHGYRQTEQVTEFTLNDVVGVECQMTRPENWLTDTKAGLYARYQHRFSSRLNSTLEGDLYFYSGTSSDSEYTTTDQQPVFKPDLHGWGKHVALTTDVSLNNKRTLLLNARYDHWFRRIEKMTDYKPYGFFSLALHYALLNDRLKMALTLSDPFGQQVTDITRVYYDFQERIHVRHHSRQLTLTLNYSLGKKKGVRIHRQNKDTETERAETHRATP